MKYKQRRGRKKLGEGAPVFQVGKMDTGLEAQLWPVGGKPSFSKHRLCSGEALTPEGTRLTHCAWAGYSCTQGMSAWETGYWAPKENLEISKPLSFFRVCICPLWSSSSPAVKGWSACLPFLKELICSLSRCALGELSS